MTATSTPSPKLADLVPIELFGGALHTVLPSDFVDVSLTCPLPDNREVYQHSKDPSTLFTVEILERAAQVADEDAGAFFLLDFAADETRAYGRVDRVTPLAVRSTTQKTADGEARQGLLIDTEPGTSPHAQRCHYACECSGYRYLKTAGKAELTAAEEQQHRDTPVRVVVYRFADPIATDIVASLITTSTSAVEWAEEVFAVATRQLTIRDWSLFFG